MAQTALANGNDTAPQRKYPFDAMKIDSREILTQVENREKCAKCFKSRKFYCYSCFIPNQSLSGKLPQVKVSILVYFGLSPFWSARNLIIKKRKK
jgi:hypothetical protein